MTDTEEGRAIRELNELNSRYMDEIADLARQLAEANAAKEAAERNAELWQKHGPAIQQMLAALDILSPLVLTRLKLQDAAMNGANA